VSSQNAIEGRLGDLSAANKLGTMGVLEFIHQMSVSSIWKEKRMR
jgi:hypothetical protein